MLIIGGFLLGALLLSPLWKSKKYKNLYLVLIWAALVFITAYRSYSFYIDTKAYYGYYKINANKDLGRLFQNVIDQEGKDPFYHFFASLMAHIGVGFRGWLVIVSIVYYTGFICVVKRFSDLPFISVFGLVALSYVFFTMTGIRQTIAMGFTFFAFIKAYDRKFIRFVLWTLLGYLFHSSALIFLLAYFVIHRKFGWLQIILLVAALGIALIFPSSINSLVRELAWNEDLAAYAETTTGLSIFGYVIQLLIGAGSILIAKKYCFEDKTGIALMNMVVLGLVFQSFVLRIDNIFRLSMYFSVYGLILMGNAITKQKEERSYIIAYWVVMAAFIAYMLYAGGYEYFTMFGTV